MKGLELPMMVGFGVSIIGALLRPQKAFYGADIPDGRAGFPAFRGALSPATDSVGLLESSTAVCTVFPDFAAPRELEAGVSKCRRICIHG